ncbi:hypothetical protein PAUR_a3808 [Pseudoalteromonas aurantia 208]|uniref:Transposase n=1 Tax=Pseudoalteromonas aurantia 208 TaxID=1314867 RepID=A0ABR9E913_9GAMM|nr:hypothetical protein [Pseudoalteromonas aurantia 208]
MFDSEEIKFKRSADNRRVNSAKAIGAYFFNVAYEASKMHEVLPHA